MAGSVNMLRAQGPHITAAEHAPSIKCVAYMVLNLRKQH